MKYMYGCRIMLQVTCDMALVGKGTAVFAGYKDIQFSSKIH